MFRKTSLIKTLLIFKKILQLQILPLNMFVDLQHFLTKGSQNAWFYYHGYLEKNCAAFGINR